MKIRNIRWGYDGGGMGCDLSLGSLIVEIMVRLDNGQTRFVTVSRYEEAEKALVTGLSLFDVLMTMAEAEADFDAEYGKVKAAAIEIYDYAIYEPDQNLLKSEFLPIVRLCRVALNTVDFETIEYGEGTMKFIAPYLMKDISELEIPSDEIRQEDGENDIEGSEVNISMLPEKVQQYLRECEEHESAESFTFHYHCELGDKSDEGEYVTSITEEELRILQAARRTLNVVRNDGQFWTEELAAIDGCEKLYDELATHLWAKIDDEIAANDDSELMIYF